MTEVDLGGGTDRAHRVLFAPLAIYGLLIYTVLLGVLEDHAETLLEIILDSVVTQAVFFVAHVFAHTLGEHAERGLRSAIVHAVRHSAAMLYAAVPPLVVLLGCLVLGTTLDKAVFAAIMTSTLIFAILGYLAYARHTSNIALRVLGGFGTALLAMIIMLVEYGIH